MGYGLATGKARIRSLEEPLVLRGIGSGMHSTAIQHRSLRENHIWALTVPHEELLSVTRAVQENAPLGLYRKLVQFPGAPEQHPVRLLVARINGSYGPAHYVRASIDLSPLEADIKAMDQFAEYASERRNIRFVDNFLDYLNHPETSAPAHNILLQKRFTSREMYTEVENRELQLLDIGVRCWMYGLASWVESLTQPYALGLHKRLTFSGHEHRFGQTITTEALGTYDCAMRAGRVPALPGCASHSILGDYYHRIHVRPQAIWE